MIGPLEQYDRLVKEGALKEDPAQSAAAKLLDDLFLGLRNYSPRKKGLFRKASTPPKGIYLWGGVGRGKSLLMDLFFESAPIFTKRRVHFHEFMSETHEDINAWRKMDNATRKRAPYLVKRAAIDDPLPHIARKIFQKANLLCFDEFQVTDIADAMILGRLFEALFDEGAIIVATSNRIPNDLYKDGLNRQLFVPFIKMIQERLTVHELKSAKDYRMEQFEGVTVYHYPLGQEATQQLDKAWERLTMGTATTEQTLQVRGRALTIPQAARGAARTTFSHLCTNALGAEDYLAIAKTYNTLFLDNIPELSPEKRNEAKRFVTLVDALYEHKTKLICSADAPPQSLYPAGDGAFEFERTVSRLLEMQTKEYLGEEHDLGEATQ